MNFILSVRSYCSNTSGPIKKSANLIRNEFLDYFKQDLGHTFIRSSPVVPLNDHTVAFVNAGMNQFKGVFLNYYDPPVLKAVNSQKCIRVSGKHNDLNVVGSDTYHHTFFEMLGNWSFGEYFKEKACRYAWDLLTNQYNINKEFLHVTYFGGDEKLKLEADLECRDIWLSIGVAKDKIIPFGLQENFWEMGISGPCGPCTEIHIDYTKQLSNRSMQVNKASSALTELWNIVFIQYLRLPDGTIVPLPKHHVDTGMGLERLVALLQGKSSNYDTDLFQPLFKAIQKYTKAPDYEGKFYNDEVGLDSGYRVLADHSRMISVALADGMIPEQSNKLRKIIRKAIDVGEKVFKKQGILHELSYAVAENLGDVYPELQDNLKTVQKIIKFEEELYIKLQNTSGKEWKKIVATRPQLVSISEWTAPGLVNGYKYLQSTLKELKATDTLTGKVAFKLYDTHGLSVETISELAEVESLNFDSLAFQNELEKLRNQSRIGLVKSSEVMLRKSLETLQKNHVLKTDDSFKYKYIHDGDNYQFPTIDSKIVALIINDNIIFNRGDENIYSIISKNTANYGIKSDEDEIGIILDKTVCYSLEGGQISDKGSISTKELNFSINNVRKINDYVIHFGKFNQSDLKIWGEKLKIGDSCIVSILPEFRIGTMQHHTAAHLLSACVKEIIQGVYPRNSLILPHNLKFQFNSFGEKLSRKQLEEIEKRVNSAIEANVPITTKILNSLELLTEDSVSLIPGEIYPYTGIRVVEVDSLNLKSKEACCGTHVFKTGILEHFYFQSYYSKGAANFNVKAVVGPPATVAKLMAEKVQSRIFALEEKLKTEEITYETFKSISKEIEHEMNNKDDEKVSVPYLIKEDCLIKLKDLNDLAKMRAKEIEKSFINMEIKNEFNATPSFVVHCLHKNLVHLSLQEAVSLYPNMPILIIVHHNGTIKAWCSVPQDLVSDSFNARTWMNIVLDVFNAKYVPTKGFDPSLVASMKTISISEASQKHLINEATEEARTFAFTHVKNS
ncbi:alanine--tRNA ligase, mitochondrial [Osmia bicornis bicornis]|uniref:alanine--tRNA ligase, mitochondrial n=1 Tax=Osmia bicornis bicornis TaxID=1437191 RepID=UPI0010F9753F|nr:alanine--tRNA ligase, mitochondrial [Osmia bicornis bicornis]